jgi:hypothetical protein
VKKSLAAQLAIWIKLGLISPTKSQKSTKATKFKAHIKEPGKKFAFGKYVFRSHKDMNNDCFRIMIVLEKISKPIIIEKNKNIILFKAKKINILFTDVIIFEFKVNIY